ncbi:uncharacterized protein Pyn_04645 [Prunus yedoensis var. nudiflora]|uniref:Putative plant transposon protein domain-containing protein n=1 Tax=Prunus yedoensis var. nudiflora TaxID=2094558 RepID=A0A314URK3_PRUYE|nr:uncharacterized protein Pyn_04645 [Prunus yedoensis var. nudiflora]
MSKLTPLRVLFEREVTLSDFKALGPPSIFESRGWLSVIGPSKPANVQIVQEFYRQTPHLSSHQQRYPDSFDVCLRGKELNFSINRIAQLLKVSRPDAPGFPALVNQLDFDFVESTLLGRQRYQSEILTHRNMKFYRILNTIVSADIDPEERLLNSSLIDFDRASLLYAIGNNNVSIDLPAYIFRAICLAATPDDYYKTHSLPFGSLITRFAVESKVRIDPTDQLKQPMPPINKMPFHNDDETDETGEESVVAFTPRPAPASDEPSPPQLNQPPPAQTKSFEKFSIQLRKRMARLANDR